jgi:DhnA family fructose-bisphosphate aldolase class Ia
MECFLPLPADVPLDQQKRFQAHAALIKRGTNRAFLFSADQKMELLHSIAPDYLFALAQQLPAGAFVTQPGLIARYHRSAKTPLHYIAKLNSKTNLLPAAMSEPLSSLLWSVDDVMELAQTSGASIIGVGYTVYLGSVYEQTMLREAAYMVREAHKHGLLALLWIYPRGAALEGRSVEEYYAGAAGVGTCLGADIIKVKPPHDVSSDRLLSLLESAAVSAGSTGIVCSGGVLEDAEIFLSSIWSWLHESKVMGVAVGRNIFERPHDEALRLGAAINALVYSNSTLEEALCIWQER